MYINKQKIKNFLFYVKCNNSITITLQHINLMKITENNLCLLKIHFFHFKSAIKNAYDFLTTGR